MPIWKIEKQDNTRAWHEEHGYILYILNYMKIYVRRGYCLVQLWSLGYKHRDTDSRMRVITGCKIMSQVSDFSSLPLPSTLVYLFIPLCWPFEFIYFWEDFIKESSKGERGPRTKLDQVGLLYNQSIHKREIWKLFL